MVQNTHVRNLDHPEQSAEVKFKAEVILSEDAFGMLYLSSLVVDILGSWFMPTSSQSLPISDYHTYKVRKYI